MVVIIRLQIVHRLRNLMHAGRRKQICSGPANRCLKNTAAASQRALDSRYEHAYSDYYSIILQACKSKSTNYATPLKATNLSDHGQTDRTDSYGPVMMAFFLSQSFQSLCRTTTLTRASRYFFGVGKVVLYTYTSNTARLTHSLLVIRGVVKNLARDSRAVALAPYPSHTI